MKGVFVLFNYGADYKSLMTSLKSLLLLHGFGIRVAFGFPTIINPVIASSSLHPTKCLSARQRIIGPLAHFGVDVETIVLGAIGLAGWVIFCVECVADEAEAVLGDCLGP